MATIFIAKNSKWLVVANDKKTDFYILATGRDLIKFKSNRYLAWLFRLCGNIITKSVF